MLTSPCASATDAGFASEASTSASQAEMRKEPRAAAVAFMVDLLSSGWIAPPRLQDAAVAPAQRITRILKGDVKKLRRRAGDRQPRIGPVQKWPDPCLTAPQCAERAAAPRPKRCFHVRPVLSP